MRVGNQVSKGKFEKVAFEKDALTRHGVILGSTGSGKCLGPNELVLMYSGRRKKAKNVVKGDLLMGPDSKPRKVLSTVTDIGSMYRITPVKGKSWICNDVHVLTLVHVTSGKIIDIPLNEYLKKSQTFKHLHKQFFTAVSFPKREESPIDPYFLGVWFGDGAKRLKGIYVHKPDKEIAQLMKNIAKDWKLRYRFDGDIEHGIVAKSGRGVNAVNPLLETMRKLLGAEVKIPSCIKYGSKKTRKAFLAGFLDTDGHLSNGVYDFVQKRKDYANDVVFIAKSLGIQASIREKLVNNKVYYRICLSGEMSKLPMRIERKKAKSRQQKKNVTRTGFTVEAIGVGRYAGFTLDGDGRFLLGDFTVTHNTGLGIRLLEELALDGVPIIAIDPKGDLGNILDVPLMGSSSEYSSDPIAIEKDITTRAKLKQVDAAIYTPGNTGTGGGKPLGIYGSSKESRSEFLKQVLSLAYGYEINSLATQYVFLEKELEYAEHYDPLGRKSNCEISSLVQIAMRPLLTHINSMLLDDYISENERMTLARKLTSLAASKDFQRWTNGELNVPSLLWKMGQAMFEKVPQLSIISIAHLPEADRKFFLPIFLSELVQTMRTWQGTDKLRAVLYIDECVGMIPSVSSPPTKNYLMTLLKQARAYGLGVILATQNPADLDYKALGNVGSWWVGRLQTDLDRKKVGEAIRGSESGVNLGSLLGKLEARQFVQSICGSSPVVVKSNDCLSRLTGPMTLEQIAGRMKWRSCQNAGCVGYRPGENEYSLYRRMIVAGAKRATASMEQELIDLEGMEQGGLRSFLWRESVKPTLKKRLRMVQEDLMQGYLVDAKRQLSKKKEKVG